MKNVIQLTSDSLDIVASVPIESGDIVVVGDLAGIAVSSANPGDLVALSLTGIYRLPKASGVSFKMGEKLFVVAAEKAVTNVEATPPLPMVGFAASSAVASDRDALVLLSRGG